MAQPAAPAEPQMFSVRPLPTCPHCIGADGRAVRGRRYDDFDGEGGDDDAQTAAPFPCVQLRPGLVVDLQAPCEDCGNVGENMMCLGCNTVRCGRHVAGHMVAHHEATGHPLVIGFLDLSIWCYGCEHYILESNPAIAPVYRAFHIAKFDE